MDKFFTILMGIGVGILIWGTIYSIGNEFNKNKAEGACYPHEVIEFTEHFAICKVNNQPVLKPTGKVWQSASEFK
jgi:hypothetical protein